MSYFPKQLVSLDDSRSTDAFARLRISSPLTLFDSLQQYGDNAAVWENATTGTGSVSYLPNESTIQLSTGGTASGAKVIRQTRESFRYQPGKSQLIVITFVFDGGAKANVRWRAGYFDTGDGFFFELDSSTVNIVKRSSTSGSTVDTAITQASWNLDKLDGTGPSGITLDVSKIQILAIDLQWLSAGRVRVGFDIGGIIVYVHEFKHANQITKAYMKTPCLPLRYEIENTGVAASASTMRQICGAVISEGGFEDVRGLQFSAGRGTSGAAVTTRRPIFSIRAATNGPNSIRNIGRIVPRDVQVACQTNDILYEVVLNGTLTGASFSSVASTSIADKDTSASAISGGTTVMSGLVVSGAGAVKGIVDDVFFRDFPLVYSGLGNQQDILSVVATSLTGSSTVFSQVTWQEYY